MPEYDFPRLYQIELSGHLAGIGRILMGGDGAITVRQRTQPETMGHMIHRAHIAMKDTAQPNPKYENPRGQQKSRLPPGSEMAAARYFDGGQLPVLQ